MKIQDKNLTERRRMAFETTTKIADLLREIVPETHEVVTTVQEFDNFVNLSVSVYERKLRLKDAKTVVYRYEYLNSEISLRMCEAMCQDFIECTLVEANEYLAKLELQKAEAEEQTEAEQDNQPQQ